MIASNLRRATVLQSPAYELRNTCDLVCRPLGTQIRSSWFRSCGQAQAAACAKGKSQRRSRPITQRSRNRGVKVVCFLATIINAVLFAAICLIPFMQCESEERGGEERVVFFQMNYLRKARRGADRRTSRASGLGRLLFRTPKISATHQRDQE